MSRPSYRHGPKGHPTNDNSTDAAATAGLSKARAQFNQPLSQLSAIFPEWKDEDLISVLEEVRGDVELAVARISEGHAEQWGAVKHKKEKKPTTHRERERDGAHGHHTSPRGASSPSSRGRGRGGARGAGTQHSRPPRGDRATNDASPAPAEYLPATKDYAQESTTETAPVAETEEDAHTAQDTQDTESRPEASVEPPPAAAVTTPSAPKTRPATGPAKLSWAQVAKPVPKPAPSQPLAPPKPVVVQPPSAVTQEPVQDAPEPIPEEPTTVEAPTWDDEPATAQPPAPEPTTDGWVDANPTSTKSEDSWTDLGAQKPEPTVQHPEPAVQEQLAPVTPQIQLPTPDTFSPPPGLANPALSSPAAQKPSTPSNSRPSYGTQRPNSRFKSDQAVILPSQAPSTAAGYAMSKTIPLQFGSLPLSDDAENENAPPEQHPVVEQTSYTNNQSPAAQSVPNHATETQPASQSTPSPAATYRLQPQQQPQQPSQEDLQTSANAAALSGPLYSQSPSVNSALAMTSGPASFTQHQPASSQHTLAGLAHTPQHSGPQGLNHTHHPSFSQQASFPQQQQQQQQQQSYDGAPPSVGGAPFSGLGQSSQAQAQQTFFRQTDSPFYNNQSQTPISEQHGFGGASGGFGGQGMQNFNGTPGLTSDFSYEGQRNPYDSYSSANSFAGRGGLRQDDVKGLGGSPAQSLSNHHGGAQPSPLGGQPSGGQGQGQGYPGMSHMGNYYYNMNINPYGYANSFYAPPPTFTSFVNPMYSAGGQTPPHGAKPGMNSSSGIGASGNSAYSTGSSGHLQHGSGGFDSDGGPNGASTYHHPTSTLPNDFQKGPYAAAGQGFLGASSGVGVNRGPGATTGVASGGVGSSTSPETAFKAYGGSAASGLGPADKSLPAQAGRGAPGANQGQQQFYQNNRYSNVPQSQGYPQQQQQQQQQQGDNYYSNFQRW